MRQQATVDAGFGTVASVAARTQPVMQWKMVVILTLLTMLAMLDRYALSLLVQPLKVDLNLTDTEVGVAVGAAFAVANIAAGLPAGWAADRFSRRAVVALGVGFWSIMAIACGLSGSFWQFCIARAGVGAGEGLIPPACYSLIRDGVAPARQGRAFGVFAMAATLGPGSALLLGGAILAMIAAFDVDALPLIGAVRPWQTVLILLGVAGLPMTLLVCLFAEPKRHQTLSATSFADVIRAMIADRHVYVPLVVFSCAAAMIASALGTWFPAFVGRSFGLTPQTVGPTLGILLIILGPAGVLLAGSAIDVITGRGGEGPGTVAVIAAGTISVFATLTPLVPSQTAMWFCEAGVLLSSTCYLAIVSTIVSRVTPPSMTGKTMALLLVLQGVMGAGLSPVLVGGLADGVYAGPAALGHALATLAGGLAVVTISSAWFLRRGLIRRAERTA